MKTIGALVIGLGALTCSQLVWASGFRVGFAKEIITPAPDLLPINTAGYLGLKATGYRIDPTQPTGKEELYARSLVLEWTDTAGTTKRFALTILDALGVSNRITKNIRAGVTNETGVPDEHQFVGATHGHNAPDLQGPYGGVPAAYKQFVEAQAIKAVVDAHNALEPAEMFVSTSAGSNLNHNRRDWGFADTDIVLVEFKKPGNGKTIGSLINFAAHPTLRREVDFLSRDFCGPLVDFIEANLDATANDIAIFVNGVVGDVNPELLPGEDTHTYGERIAQEAISSRMSQVQVDTTQATMQTIEWDLTVGGALHSLLYMVGRLDYDARWENQKLKILTKLGYLRFGNTLEIVTFPGESLTRNGAEIKMHMTAEHKVFLGLTGDALGYFVPTDEWGTWPFSCRNNCYEEWLSPGRRLGDEAITKLTDMM
jgi:hypothetical protein